ncbi:MAG: hypothetical protein HZA54_12905 [Planctomycetes bacterium]|nr:hypothetical protein [Planctomycetota bacterium]
MPAIPDLTTAAAPDENKNAKARVTFELKDAEARPPVSIYVGPPPGYTGDPDAEDAPVVVLAVEAEDYASHGREIGAHNRELARQALSAAHAAAGQPAAGVSAAAVHAVLAPAADGKIYSEKTLRKHLVALGAALPDAVGEHHEARYRPPAPTEPPPEVTLPSGGSAETEENP